MTGALLIARQSVRLALRENTVLLMVALFAVLVLLSAWLGWQATATVDRIYTDAAAFLAAAGQPVPTNPVLDTSPLILLRNMAVYVTLLGALSAIVIGNHLVAADRGAGVLPLIGSRSLPRNIYACGKLLALSGLVLALMLAAAVIGTVTLLALPAVQLHPGQWGRLAGFFGLSALYMGIFGLLSLAAAAATASRSVGLLIPVALWLAVTFILPALTLNLTPTAVLNPISALVTPPDAGFFQWAGWLLGPLSVSQAYGTTAAGLLEFRPLDWLDRSAIGAGPTLGLWCAASLTLAFQALLSLPFSTGDYDA